MSDVSPTERPSTLGPAARWGLVVGVALVVIVADQLTKQWALERLSGGQVIDLVGSLRFNLAFNTGMAFSKGSGSGSIIGVIALGIVAVLAFVARRVESKVQLALIGLVIGGALGNIVDRLSRVGEQGSTGQGFMSGAVVDFIDLQWWPVFNIADAAVVCGGIALALLSLRAPAEAPDLTDPSGSADDADRSGPTDDVDAAGTDADLEPAPAVEPVSDGPEPDSPRP